MTKQELIKRHKELMKDAKNYILGLEYCVKRLGEIENELNLENKENAEYKKIYNTLSSFINDNTRWYQDEDYKEFSSIYLGNNDYLIRYTLSFNDWKMYMIVTVASITEKHRRAVDFARHFMKQSGLIDKNN